MPNGRNEALCLTCLHVVAIADKRYCSLHKVILPIDSFGHWLICCNWQDENLPDSSNLTRWKQEYLQLSDKTILYKYHIYTYGPAIPVAAFADLEKCE